MLQLTVEMLVKYKKIEWQGSLRKTYNKYLHPDVIDKVSLDMWDILCKGELISAFQFVGPVGEQAIKSIQPRSLIDTANANTVMRLMVEGDDAEQPLARYARYKNDIQEWYKDMRAFGLTEDMIKVLEEHLLQDYGVMSSQERMMIMTMDERIAGFGVIESNTLRKGVAKKQAKIIEEAKKMFFKWGAEHKVPQILLDYVWDDQIAMQLGYGFSILHSVAYTIILIQQLNLVYYYPAIYWNTAVLLVESGAVERESSEEQEGKSKEKTTNYGKVAKAIGDLQTRGVNISLPYINESEQGFLPNEENNEIIFGFKGIMSINNETSQIIMENKPYKSLHDFHERLVEVKREVTLTTGKKQQRSLVSSSQTIMLIKAGAFDKLENKPREEILEDYLRMLYPPKAKLTSTDISKISEFGIMPPEFKECLRFYNFRDFIMKFNKTQDEETKSLKWYKIKCDDEEMTEYTSNFFMEHFANEMNEFSDYRYSDDGYLEIGVGPKRKGSFESAYGEKIKPLTNWIATKECKEFYNEIVFNNRKRENMDGTISSWEMESMNYYYHEHELTNVNREQYGIVDFHDLPEEPTVIGFTKYKNHKYPKFKLDRIVGTILDRDRNKHSITLLTPTGVVTVKFYGGQFAFYDKTISKVIGLDEKGKPKKVTLEDGWFKRGTKVMITGFRRGDQFKPKRYSNSIYQHTVSKITDINEDGTLNLVSDRVQVVD